MFYQVFRRVPSKLTWAFLVAQPLVPDVDKDVDGVGDDHLENAAAQLVAGCFKRFSLRRHLKNYARLLTVGKFFS